MNGTRRMEGSYKRRQRESVCRRDGPNCHFCGVVTVPAAFSNDERPNVRSVDHVVPHSQGGTNAVENLVIACLACNRAKADRPTLVLVGEPQ